MKKIIDRKIYDTETATRLAHSEYRDGSNRLSGGRGTTLYLTGKGTYFLHYETSWQGENDRIWPIDRAEAIETWERAYNQEPFETAFPGVEVVDG